MKFGVIAALAVPLLMRGQIAQLSGLVTDASGAPLPGASVLLTKEDTGTRYASQSSTQGYYFIPATQPGVYKIRIRKDGFQTSVQLGVRLTAGQDTRIDFVLQLGIRQETVEVKARATPLDTEDSTAGTVIDREAIESMPLSGRNLLPLLESVPGITVTPAGGGESGQFSSNGQRADSNLVTVDGVSVNDGIGVIGLASGHGVQLGGVVPVYTTMGTTQSFVSADSIEELLVQTPGSRAEWGRSMGAHVIVTTRSGSNGFHGGLAGYLRNEALDANDWFANRGGQAGPRFRMSDLSATIGGPIRRNRTFFFVSQESLRLDHPAVTTSLVPTALARLDAPPGAAWLTTALPLPNGPDFGGGLGLLTLDAPRTSSLDFTSIRVDHAIGSKVKIFSRVSRSPSLDSTSNPGSLIAGRISVSSINATAGVDAALSASAYQSIRLNWSAPRESSSTWTEALGRSVDLSQFLPPLSDPSQTVYSMQILDPSIAMVTDRAIGRQRQWNLVDTTSITHGSHTVVLGADYRALWPGLNSKPYMITAVFGNLDSFAARRPLEIAVAERNSVSLRLRNLSAFAQDTWRISSRVVLNYGLRWEDNPAPAGHSGAPLFAAVTPGQPLQVRFGQQGNSLWNGGWGSLAPRVGIAWKLDAAGKTVLRASAGVFYDPGFAAVLQAAISQIATNVSVVDPSGGSITYSQNSTAIPASASALAANFRMPYSAQWNGTLDRQVARRSTVSLSWVGAADRRLLRLEQTQMADGESLAFYTNHGQSSYQALQAQWRVHLRPEIDLLSAFTWAHSIDNVSRDSDPFLWQPGWPGSIDRGNSTFDVRRSFSAAFTASPRGWKGWSAHGLLLARTGFPLTVMALDPSLPFGLESRPDLVAGQAVWMADPGAPGGRRLNSAAFAASSLAQPGTLGRNAILGFGMSQLDLAVQREFRLRDRLTTQLRVEGFNVLNHPNFGNPDSFLTDPTFGRAGSMLNQFLGTGGPSMGLVPAFQMGGPRSMQIALRFRL
jgi:hypothetical protein